MLTDEQRAYLQKPHIARVTTIDADGYPHTVPVWYMLDGDDVVVFGYASTRKIAHIRANTKGCVSIGGDPATTPGFLFKGDWALEPDNGWSRKITYHYEGQEQGEAALKSWGDIEYAVMRLKVKKVLKVS
jgi:general stress protein 26